MKANYYTILGLERNASEMQIRKRFHELARQHHPDRFDGAEKADAEEKFQTITEAFNNLSRPESRRQHDRELSQAPASTSPVDDRLSHAYVQQGVAAYREGHRVGSRRIPGLVPSGEGLPQSPPSSSPRCGGRSRGVPA